MNSCSPKGPIIYRPTQVFCAKGCSFLYWVSPTHVRSPFSPSFQPFLPSLSCLLMMSKYNTLTLLNFASSESPSMILLKTHLFVFLAAHEYLQSSPPKPRYKQVYFYFLLNFFLVHLSISIHNNWEYHSMDYLGPWSSVQQEHLTIYFFLAGLRASVFIWCLGYRLHVDWWLNWNIVNH